MFAAVWTLASEGPAGARWEPLSRRRGRWCLIPVAGESATDTAGVGHQAGPWWASGQGFVSVFVPWPRAETPQRGSLGRDLPAAPALLENVRPAGRRAPQPPVPVGKRGWSLGGSGVGSGPLPRRTGFAPVGVPRVVPHGHRQRSRRPGRDRLRGGQGRGGCPTSAVSAPLPSQGCKVLQRETGCDGRDAASRCSGDGPWSDVHTPAGASKCLTSVRLVVPPGSPTPTS